MNGAFSSPLLPFLTGALVAVFTVLLAMQWRRRRKPHQLWWTIGFALYSAAAFLEFAMMRAGSWSPGVFRIYALMSATLVAVLAQGSVSLVTHRPFWPRAYLAYNAVCAVIFAYGVFTAKLVSAALAHPLLASYAPLGGTAGTYPRFLSLLLTIPAALVLFWTAARSVVRFLRKKEFAYRMWANVLIGGATLVIASGGGLAKAGNTTLFYITEIVAAVLYFAGVLLAGTLKPGADKLRAEHAAARAAAAAQSGREAGGGTV